MALIPEEFPVVLTVFLSMGAWRLAKNIRWSAVCRRWKRWGQCPVLCCDKTGTLTMNKMSVGRTWAADKDERTLLMLWNGL